MVKYIGKKTTSNIISANGVFDNDTVYKKSKYLNWPISSRTPSVVIKDGLYFNYDASVYSGSTWTDLSGNNRNGTLLNSPTNTNGIFTFNGINQEVSTNLAYQNHSSSFTYGGWFKTSRFNTSNLIMTMESNATGTGSTGYDKLFYINTLGQAVFGSFSSVYITSTITYWDNKWHHFIATFDATTTIHTLYIDNIFIGSGSMSKTSSLVYIRIAGYKQANWPNAADNYFQGSLGQVYMYNRALTRNEITFNYLNSKDRFNG